MLALGMRKLASWLLVCASLLAEESVAISATGSLGSYAPKSPATEFKSEGCKRLKQEGLDCAACVKEFPEEKAKCAGSAAGDAEIERIAMFGTNVSKARKLWKSTNGIWATDQPRKVELVLSEAQWKFLYEDPGKEEYVKGGIRISGLGEWKDVGIRFKGFYGSLRICLHQGLVKCKKLPIKIKFNKYNKTQRCLGLKKLQLQSTPHDVSLMRERLTFSIFREMGIPAPRQAHSDVHLDLGTKQLRLGVFLLSEVIDGRFTEAFYKGGDGNLYKEVWPGIPDATKATAFYQKQLQTNEEQKDTARLVDFGVQLSKATSDWELVQLARNFTHAKQWARYFAVDRLVQHWDGPMNFREQGKDTWWTHNFFMYEDDNADHSKREFSMVPWDVDGTWSGKGQTTPVDWDAPVCQGHGMDTCADDEGTWRMACEMSAECSLTMIPDCATVKLYGVCSNAEVAKICKKSCGECTPKAASSDPNAPWGCIDCKAYETGSSNQMPPSCFKMLRVQARGLRSYYMNATLQLLQGPAQACRIRDKLTRWHDQIASLVKLDGEQSLYPVTGGTTTWEAAFTSFSTTSVQTHILGFKKSVNCSREYNPDGWDDVVANREITTMLSMNDYNFGPWCEAPSRSSRCEAPSYSCAKSLMCPNSDIDATKTVNDGKNTKCIDIANFCATNTMKDQCASGQCVSLAMWFNQQGCCEKVVESQPKPAASVVLSGSMNMEVPLGFKTDAVAQAAVKDGIAEGAGVPASYVALTISDARRRLEAARQLEASVVKIGYKITIPASSMVTASTATKNLNTKSTAALTALVQAKVTTAKGADYAKQMTVQSKTTTTDEVATVPPANANSAGASVFDRLVIAGIACLGASIMP